MSLKNYLSIKFILFISFTIIIGFITTSITSESRRLKRENRVLVFHKKIYQKILELPATDVEGRKELLMIVKTSDVQESIKESYFSVSTQLYFLFLVFVLGFYFVDILNKKIELLKNKETDFEKQQML